MRLRSFLFLLACVGGCAPAMMAQPTRDYQGTQVSLTVPSTLPDQDATSLLKLLEQNYGALKDSLRLIPPDLVGVVMPRNRYDAEVGEMEMWKPVTQRGNRLLMRAPSSTLEWERLRPALQYQLVLAFTEQAVIKGCPRWYAEAYALYYAGLPEDRKPPLKGTMSSFEDLSQDMQRFPQPPGRTNVECTLSLTMEFFVKAFGTSLPMKAFSVFDGKQHPNAVFESVFGVPVQELERQWAAYLQGLAPRFKKPELKQPPAGSKSRH